MGWQLTIISEDKNRALMILYQVIDMVDAIDTNGKYSYATAKNLVEYCKENASLLTRRTEE